jgi:NAD(P)-dependent dehydrogenase (short-subunit alcohol dehydrogenase family)
VTGSSRGIGAAIADRLALDGFTVYRPDRKTLDLSDPDAVRVFAEADDLVPDALVLNAGENIPMLLADLSTEHWRHTINVNLNSCFELIRVYGPRMAEAGRGSIVAISSCFSFRGRSGRGPYAASKAALNSLIRVAALEYGPSGVLANTVCPGFVMTDLTQKNNDEEAISSLAATTALGRLAEPEEIAGLVAFLASKNNTYITGQTLTIDGGYSCQ